jgi:cytochrome P450
VNETTPAAPPPLALIGADFLADPYRKYRMLHDMDPVLYLPGLFGLGAWAVTSHAACSSVLRGKQFGKEGQKVVAPEKLSVFPLERGEAWELRRSNMLFRDPPDHTRLRSLVSQAFTPRIVERLRPSITAITEHLLDAVAGQGRMDLVRDFAFPLPVIVIAELLGVPPEHRDQFKAWSTDLTLGLSPGATAEDLDKVLKVIGAMNTYFAGVVEERRRAPRADLISELVRAQEAGDKLSDAELLTTCRLLLTAGHETTVNLIGNGALALLRHPEERAALAADPSLLPNAVEELLRYDSPVQMTTRFAMEDAPLGDKTAKRGDMVVVLVGGANRDPQHFPDPDRLDLRRANAHSHLSFGGGIHYCLGAPLARLEGEIAIGALLRRFPKLALGSEELVWRLNPVLRGLQALPVTF